MNVEKVGTYDTAGSAKMIADGNMEGCAAIASDLAAETYGMEVLASNIEDDDMNFTRFLLLARTVSYVTILSTHTYIYIIRSAKFVILLFWGRPLCGASTDIFRAVLRRNNEEIGDGNPCALETRLADSLVQRPPPSRSQDSQTSGLVARFSVFLVPCCLFLCLTANYVYLIDTYIRI